MRFIHSSDWQLGKPFGRASEQTRAALLEARLYAIDALAAAARREGAGPVLVAGDVFDSPEPGDRTDRPALTRLTAAPDARWASPEEARVGDEGVLRCRSRGSRGSAEKKDEGGVEKGIVESCG